MSGKQLEYRGAYYSCRAHTVCIKCLIIIVCILFQFQHAHNHVFFQTGGDIPCQRMMLNVSSGHENTMKKVRKTNHLDQDVYIGISLVGGRCT